MKDYFYRSSALMQLLSSVYDAHQCSRNRLLFSMLAQRSVPRYLCAPSGYGKTFLAYQYADLAFDTETTLWIDASRPEFLRDFDTDCLLEMIVSSTDEVGLVVIDKVPALSKLRKCVLAQLSEELCELGWEVVVTTREKYNADEVLGEAVLIDAHDLLFDDDEMHEVGKSNQKYLTNTPLAAQRIPALAYNDELSRLEFIRGLSSDTVSDEAGLLRILTLILGEGSLRELQPFVSVEVTELASELHRSYPHCGVKQFSPQFKALSLSEKERYLLLESQLEGMVSSSGELSEEGVLETLCAILRRKDEISFVTKIVGNLASRSIQKRFFLRYAKDLLFEGYVDSVDVLIEALGSSCLSNAEELFLYAENSALLGDREQCEHALALLDQENVGDEYRLCSAHLRLVNNLCSAEDFMTSLNRYAKQFDSADSAESLNQCIDVMISLEEKDIAFSAQIACRALLIYLAVNQRKQAIVALEQIANSGVLSTYLMDFMVVVFTCIDANLGDQSEITLEDLSSLLTQVLLREMETLPANRYEPSLESTLVSLYGHRANAFLPASFFKRSQKVSARLSKAMAIRRKTLFEEVSFKNAPVQGLLNDEKMVREYLGSGASLPLKVHTFGGLTMTWKGSTMPANGKIRAKVREFLCLLAIAPYRELSRAWLERVLWPHADVISARQSFYNLLSYTRKLFEKECGLNTVIVSNHKTVSFNRDLVETDVMVMEKVISVLKASEMANTNYENALAVIESLYHGSILPESECSEITSFNTSIQLRMVDALFSAAEHLFELRDYRLAQQYAQLAFDIDRSREDVCYVLMACMKERGQYVQAMDAFMECKRVLVEKYGIESSQRLLKLYEEVLEGVS